MWIGACRPCASTGPVPTTTGSGAVPICWWTSGAGAWDALIVKVEAAVKEYPYQSSYRTWPGPNSNTFTAYIGRAVPELRLDLPPTAIGKDYLPGGALAAMSPGGRGVQLSLFGLAGLLAGVDEGIEVNLLGLTFGLDVKDPALKLPGVGRVGHP